MKRLNVLVLAVLTGTTFAALAQQPATTTIPVHSCEKPVGGPGLQPTYEQQKRFQSKVDDYKECINKYVAEVKKLSDEHFDIVKKYQDAGNAAINEYNTYVNDLNAQHGAKEGEQARPVVPPASSGRKY